MTTIGSVADLTEFGRIQLSPHFFMRDMLYSEVANFHGMPNIPESPELAIEAGRNLCERVLEPLHRAFGGIVVRSAYRSPTVNDFCHQRLLAGETTYYCGSNEYSRGRHIWDRRDGDGHLGATASVVIPWYLPQFRKTNDPRPLGWWLLDSIDGWAEVLMMPWLCAFNIRWYEGPSERAIWIDPGGPGKSVLLTKRGEPGFEGDHRDRYPGFPPRP